MHTMADKQTYRINNETFVDSSDEEEESDNDDKSSFLDSSRSFTKSKNITRLEDLPWFHGDMSRNTSEALLLSNGGEGTYLLRLSGTNPGKFSVSVRCLESVKHYTLEYDPYTKNYVFGKGQFDSLDKLMDHFDCQPMLSDIHGHSVILKFPYMRDIEEPSNYEYVVSHGECSNTLQNVREALPDLHIASKEGFLVKRGAIHKNWNKRWFVLQKNILKYYKRKYSLDPIREIDLKDASEVCESYIDNKNYCFHLCLPYRTFYIHGKSTAEAKQWMKLLQWKIDHYMKEKEKSLTI